MPFVSIKPKLRLTGGSVSLTHITIGAYLAEGISKPRNISFRIPFQIMIDSGIPFENHKAMIGIHEGVGTDVGFVQLYHEPDPRVGISSSQGHKKERTEPSNQGFTASFRFERLQYYAPTEWPITATQVNHIVEGNSLIIEVPDWFRPNLKKMEEDGLYQPKEPTPSPQPKPRLVRGAEDTVRRTQRT